MDWQDRADEFESEMKDQMADENTTEIDENLSDDEVVEETEKVPHNANLAVPDVPKEVSTFTNIATARMQEDFVSGKRDVNETGKEIVHALTLEKSVEETRENRDFLADIKKTKQDELKLNFENKVLEEERKKLEAKQNKAEAQKANEEAQAIAKAKADHDMYEAEYRREVAVEHLPLLTVQMVTVENNPRRQVFKEAEVLVLGSTQVVLIQVLKVVMVLQLFIIRRHNYGCM